MSSKKGGRTALRKLISGSRKGRERQENNGSSQIETTTSKHSPRNGNNHRDPRPEVKTSPDDTATPSTTSPTENNDTNNNANTRNTTERGRGGGNIIQRLRERSRSRSRSSRAADSVDSNTKDMLVAVTSCRSDGYYNQKAPGSTFKLPRKAPTNLKLFHELAVGVKDAYAALGATPKNPTDEEKSSLDPGTLEARTVLWDFVGNLDFVRTSGSSVGSVVDTCVVSHAVCVFLSCFLLLLLLLQ